MASYVDMNRLATMVRIRRGVLGLRETAKEIGNISPSTLSRVENAKMPDMETFLLLCDWLQVQPDVLIKNTEDAGKSSVLDTPDAITIQLQSDKNLDPAIAPMQKFIESAALTEKQ